jgi:hypothetical protein
MSAPQGGVEPMTVRQAQLYLVGFALLSLIVCIITFVTGRSWRLPLDYNDQEHIPLLQMLVAPFLGILGSAAAYLGGRPRAAIPKAQQSLLLLMTVGPSGAFLVLFGVITASFHAANQPGSTVLFKLSEYRTWLSILLGLLACSTAALSTILFRAGEAPRPPAKTPKPRTPKTTGMTAVDPMRPT